MGVTCSGATVGGCCAPLPAGLLQAALWAPASSADRGAAALARRGQGPRRWRVALPHGGLPPGLIPHGAPQPPRAPRCCHRVRILRQRRDPGGLLSRRLFWSDEYPLLSGEKLVSSVAESASALQEAADSSSSLKELLDTTSLQEPISASPGTAVPHNSVDDDASWRSSTFSCEKLVAGAPESASSQTLGGEADVSSLEELINTASSQELVTASPPTAPCNNNLDGSSTTSPFRHEKTVAGVAESAHAQAMRERELQRELDEFIEEVLGYSSSEDQTTTISPRAEQHCPRTAPCNNTLDGSSSTTPFRHEKTVAGVTESAHPQAMQELELDQFIEELLGYTSSEDRTTSPQAVQHNSIDGGNQRLVLRNTTDSTLPAASSLGSKILRRRMADWFYWYYIRMDRQGSFRMYPDLGGPFHSLQEAEDAINRHYDELWCQHWRNVQVSAPDGGRCSSTSRPKNNKDDEYRYLVKALLDQYNEDNNLFGNLAHELDEDVVMEQWIIEDHTWYYHYNFTTKKREAGDISLGTGTFFAEVSHKLGECALEVNCCCKMEDEDIGWCYGCKNNGSHGMRHPKNLDAYLGEHEDVFLPFDLEEPSSSDDEDAKEARLRDISEDNPQSCVSGSLFPQQASTVEGY